MKHVINWFSIPAIDLERAVNFYEKVFATTLDRQQNSGKDFAIFPYDPPNPSGGICIMPQRQPGTNGPLIYLDASPDVAPVLARAQANGGTILLEKTLVSDDIGYVGIFMDTEGNSVGVHAPK